MFPELARFTGLTLLFLRLMVAAVFVTSGWNDLKDPKGRGGSMGMGRGMTLFIGTAEVAGGLGLAFGVATQLAALGLSLIMAGAVYKKIFVWHSGFWGAGTSGWHYDLMLLVMNLVIASTGGGCYVLWQ